MKMMPSTTTLVCLTLTLAALVQADLSAMTAEVRAHLSSSEHAFEALVDEVRTKGPEFAKCVVGAVDYQKAVAAANAAIDACQAKAADSLATPPCLTKDVACLEKIDAFKFTTLTAAGRCMLPAVNRVDAVDARLTTDIVECDRRTGKNFVALPAGRKSWWVKNRDKVWKAVGKVIEVATGK